jgi:hypothetical protein
VFDFLGTFPEKKDDGSFSERLAEALANYNPDDDKKILCLMVDQEKINKGTDIPFIRTLFKTGIHYEYQLVRRDELLFINSRTNETLNYFDCDY